MTRKPRPNCFELAAYADELLQITEFKDYPNALNGLQVENRGEVKRIAAAVDACLPVILEAVRREVDLLVVHHGLFWGGLQPLRGASYEKVASLLGNGLALYSAHLPLDAHATIGNNAILARKLGVKDRKPFLEMMGRSIGWQGRLSMGRAALVAKLEDLFQAPVHVAPGGPTEIRRIGIASGGSGDAVHEAVAAGVDTFLAGEGPHWSYTAAEELGINLIYGGHYATETWGVAALAERLGRKFKVETTFIDHPTGL